MRRPYPVLVHSTIVKNDTIPWPIEFLSAPLIADRRPRIIPGTLKESGHDWTHVIPLPAGLITGLPLTQSRRGS